MLATKQAASRMTRSRIECLFMSGNRIVVFSVCFSFAKVENNVELSKRIPTLYIILLLMQEKSRFIRSIVQYFVSLPKRL